MEAKPKQTLTNVREKSLKLVNEWALVGKKYANKYSNINFSRALPQEWCLKTIIIRSLIEVSFYEVYTKMKTNDLKMQKRKKGLRKIIYVSLNGNKGNN